MNRIIFIVNKYLQKLPLQQMEAGQSLESSIGEMLCEFEEDVLTITAKDLIGLANINVNKSNIQVGMTLLINLLSVIIISHFMHFEG